MKLLRIVLGLTLAAFLFTQCQKDEMTEQTLKRAEAVPAGTFTVKIKNVSMHNDFYEAGYQVVPVDSVNPGPAFPGASFKFTFHAGRGHRLSFATMYGASNDLFFAPAGTGIELFNGNTPLEGDITSLIGLWDAGTEVNHTGTDEDPHQPVMNIADVGDPHDYGSVASNIYAWLEYNGSSTFTLTLHVKSDGMTPLSPVAWVVHSGGYPIFEVGQPDYGNGLEHLAEMGNAVDLGENLIDNSGYISPISPGVWVVHKKGQKPIFKEGSPDYGLGLEDIAEMGDPTALYQALMDAGFDCGVYNTPDGASGPAPLFAGDSYTFHVSLEPGDYLSFASMLGTSNDLFFAFDEKGMSLFNGNRAKSGELHGVYLWDAGTEVNELPGAATMDTEENGTVRKIMDVNDGFNYPEIQNMIEVSVWQN
mgnify:CR=1 FL=1